MAVRVAINGFGRIGRLVLRSIIEHNRDDVKVVAINDLGPVATNAHLLQYDSVHGKLGVPVTVDGDTIKAGNQEFLCTAVRDPKELPWREMDVDIAFECTGIFTARDQAAMHLEAGAKRVLVSAPASGADKTIVYGVNHDTLTKSDLVVSNASCTTNCLSPVAKTLNDAIGIERGLMTTIHAYTATQKTVDGPSRKAWRDGRAAATNIIPASTGAAKAVSLVCPEVKGKLSGMAFRVPTPTTSVVDLTFKTEKSTSYDEISAAMKNASETYLKNILGYTEDAVVSTDFIHCADSSIYDQAAGMELNENFFKLVSWYDNEWGYSNRVGDLLKLMIEKGL